MDSAFKEAEPVFHTASPTRPNVCSAVMVTSSTDSSSARKKTVDVRPTPTESVPNVRQSTSSSVTSASHTPKAASNTQEKTALFAATTTSSRMASASTGSQQVWLFWEVLIAMTSRSIRSMSDSPSTTLITCLLPPRLVKCFSAHLGIVPSRIAPFLLWKEPRVRDGKPSQLTRTSLSE